MSDELRDNSSSDDGGEQSAAIDPKPPVAPISRGTARAGDGQSKIVATDSALRGVGSSAVSALEASLVPRIDTSWMSAVGASLAAKIDTSWMAGIETITRAQSQVSAISAVGASLAAKIDTSWMAGIETITRAQSQVSAISAVGASLAAKIDTSWMAGIETITRAQSQVSAISAVGASLIPKIDTSWIERLEVSLPELDTSWLKLSWFVQQHVRGLPPNWRDVESLDALDDDKLRSIVLDEGIPLAWVPSSALIDRLLDAEDARERRELLRNGWRGVINDCVRVSSQLPSGQSRGYARFIANAASTFRDGHYEAAQALAANLVDTLGRSHVRGPVAGYNWSIVTAKNERPKLSKLELRALLVLGPLAVGHSQFHPDDAVPRTFSRHATAHGVSRRQYTRVNSLIALMNATALLCWLERDSDAFLDA